MTSVVHLRTEYNISPLNICGNNPLFSWRIESDVSGIMQKSARVKVFRNGSCIWDSGNVPQRECFMRCTGVPLQPDLRYTWNVELGLTHGSDAFTASGAGAYFETNDLAGAGWICGSGEGYHIFSKKFTLISEAVRASFTICALGTAETDINGIPATDSVLEPGWTDYRKTALYTAYDITDKLRTGENTVAIKLGDGMYNVPGGGYVYFPRSFGSRKLCAVLRAEFKDGTEISIPTDTSWETIPSPIRFCCIYGGEDIDRRKSDIAPVPALPAEAPDIELLPALIPPEKIGQVYEPISVRHIPGKGWLYDFGTNLSGWVSLTVKPDSRFRGCEINIIPSEILDGDGLPDQRVTGKGYHWKFILNGEDTSPLHPDFTYTGFRYALVTGAAPADAGIPDLPAITGIESCFIYPGFEEEGGFECSEPLFNQIHAIIRQAMLSNSKSYFTDCPHREKLPWLEQTHLIGPSMLYMWELEPLFEKICRDMADSQWDNGVVPDISPEYVTAFAKWHTGFADSPEWGSASVLVPWYTYKKTGDAEILRRAYPTMKKYTLYLASRAHHSILNHGLGDWLDIGPCKPYSQNTPIAVTATAMYYMDLRAMKACAELLDNSEDAQRFSELIQGVYEEYNALFLDDQTGRYANGSQACQSMSLAAGLVPESFITKALDQLRKDVEKRGYAITAGDVGHPYLVHTLTTMGLNELLYRMTLVTDRPGYGYQVVNGATTLNEEWDGCEPGNPHGSQNHLMLGSIEGWFFGGLCGIASVRDTESAYDLRITPYVPEGMQWARASAVHPCGKIFSGWERTEGGIIYTVKLPPNVTAHFRDMSGNEITLLSGTHTLRGGVEI